MRLNKFLSDRGYCSRRKADQLIEAGQVKVNGVVAVLGTQVEANDRVEVEGKCIGGEAGAKIYIALNKPRGIECTADPNTANNIIDYIGHSERIYPVGRLDKESEGLIFLTNDGAFADYVMRAANHHEKEYHVWVNRPITQTFIQTMSQGVLIEGRKTRPCIVEQVNKTHFKIVLTQGMNRQIRYMCRELGYRVVKLVRVRIMAIGLGELKLGKWRELSKEEVDKIYQSAMAKEE